MEARIDYVFNPFDNQPIRLDGGRVKGTSTGEVTSRIKCANDAH
jgi:hypothetical protein